MGDALKTPEITAWPYRLRLTLRGDRLPIGETLHDFPLLVALRKQCLRSMEYQGHVARADGGDLRFATVDAEQWLDFEIEHYDPMQGALTAWVRLPCLTGGHDFSFWLLYGCRDAPPVSAPYRVWDRHFHAVLHFREGGNFLRDSTALRHDGAGGGAGVVAAPGIINYCAALSGNQTGLQLRGALAAKLDALTIEGWVNSVVPAAERMQTVAGQWQICTDTPRFSIYHAERVSGLELGGFLGAVCDGRYVYFVPHHDRTRRHGKVLRFDTTMAFNQLDGWQAYDAGNTGGLSARGYCGAVFDGAFIYFVPRQDDDGCHARFLRYDTRLPFQSPAAWEAFDAEMDFACQGGGFDGRYAYFPAGANKNGGYSGAILRYDTTAPFKKKSAWEVFDAAQVFGESLRDFAGATYDGRYLYFVPRRFNIALRYDTAGEFNHPESWEIFDAGCLGMRQCVGAVFDGRYLYYVPCDNHVVVCFDTTRRFSAREGWRAWDVRQTDGISAWGYAGGFFDGCCVYFIPFFGRDGRQKPVFHNQMLCYDTRRDFSDAAAWRVLPLMIDGRSAIGYNGGAFDGGAFYCAPWHDGEIFMAEKRIEGHARVLRCETLHEQSAFILKCADYGHNGGLCGGVIGPSFSLRTTLGAFTVRQNSLLPHGWHHLAGVYDGRFLRLFVDGRLIAEQAARGQIVAAQLPLSVGAMADGCAPLQGSLDELRLSITARSAAWLRLSYENQRAPESFCVVDPEETSAAADLPDPDVYVGRSQASTVDHDKLQ